MDNAKLTASIQAHEGLRLTAYTDTTGNISIGYGRNLNGKGISVTEANYLLSNDIGYAISEAQAQTWWPHVVDNDARSRAFIELLFNLGSATLSTFTKALIAAMADDWFTCANEFRDSIWYQQVGSQPGQRGYIIAYMIETGSDPS